MDTRDAVVSTHTPGPWRTNELAGDVEIAVLESSDFDAIEIYAPREARTVEEMEGTARLITAAPDLLDALKEMRDACAVAMRILSESELENVYALWLQHAGVQNGFGVRAQNAIAKAEGRSATL